MFYVYVICVDYRIIYAYVDIHAHKLAGKNFEANMNEVN